MMIFARVPIGEFEDKFLSTNSYTGTFKDPLRYNTQASIHDVYFKYTVRRRSVVVYKFLSPIVRQRIGYFKH